MPEKIALLSAEDHEDIAHTRHADVLRPLISRLLTVIKARDRRIAALEKAPLPESVLSVLRAAQAFRACNDPETWAASIALLCESVDSLPDDIKKMIGESL